MKTTVLLGIVLTSIVVVSNLEALDYSVFRLLLVLEIAVVPLVGIFVAVRGRVKRRSKMTSLGIVLILSSVLGVFITREISHSMNVASEDLGDQICLALGEYEEVFGSYPSSLEELVPDYLGQIPASRVGVFSKRPFSYSLGEGHNFELGFVSMGGFYNFRNRDGQWLPLLLWD